MVIFERVYGLTHKRMQERRLKYLDPISSLCEGIGELKYRPQKSTFNASDREFLFRTWVTGGIEKKHVGDIHHCFLMRSQSYKTTTTKKKKRYRGKFSSFKVDMELLSVTQVIEGIEKVVCGYLNKSNR